MYEDLIIELRAIESYGSTEISSYEAGQYADAIEDLSKPNWIPVNERLPEPYTSVLLYSGEELYIGYMHSDKRFTVNASHFPDRPTHWMPLPKPPEEGK